MRIVKKHPILMRFLVIGLHDRRTSWPVGGIQNDHLLSWGKFHGLKISCLIELSNNLKDVKYIQMLMFVNPG